MVAEEKDFRLREPQHNLTPECDERAIVGKPWLSVADLSDYHSVVPGRLAYFMEHPIFKVYLAMVGDRIFLLLRLANSVLL